MTLNRQNIADTVLCSVPDCDRVARHLTLKLCNRHTLRYRRYGDPTAGGALRETPVHLVHGTINGYTSLGCRCPECREANRVACAAAKARRIGQGVPDRVHGTVNGYMAYNCRCAPCRQANTDYFAARKERR